MDLHKTKTRALREFQSWAHRYDRSLLNFAIFRPSYRIMLTHLRKRAPRNGQSFRILDIGCGTGSFLARCMATGANIEAFGLDMAYNMIHIAKRKADSIEPGRANMSFTVGDAERLPFDSAFFDMVTCSNSFHHYPHQSQALREMRRVLKDNGELIIVDGHRDDPLGYLIFDICVDAVEKHVRHCSRRLFTKMFKEAGFQKVSYRMEGLFPPLLAVVGKA